MTTIKIGNSELELGGAYVTEMRDSSGVLHDTNELHRRMEEDGYLLLRGFHDRRKVLEARMQILQRLEEQNNLDLNFPIEDGVISPDNSNASYRKHTAELTSLLEIVNGEPIMKFFDRFLGGKAMTLDFKWTRAVGAGEFTGAHYDAVFMNRGTKNLYTVWTPIGDISYQIGGLCLCPGSQRWEKVVQTYGQMDLDRDNIDNGWFSSDLLEVVDKYGGKWATTEYRAGDVLIFGMYMMHGSLTNQTNQYRLSVDTRYQLAAEPVDERWVGTNPIGHTAPRSLPPTSMAEARKRWGV
ncbi:MAG: phytanoyl-CoA dioxygenase family protein [Paenibacillaceae bacterium]|nr:phytanoyl-CoA dioxygenase family protein [Paenibacillaceae bacterium]